MMIFRRLAIAVLMGLLCPGALIAQAVTVRVRLLYFKNGKPAQREQVRLYLGEASRASTPKLDGNTSSDGFAVFHLAPLPKSVWVYVENGHVESCAVEGLIPLDEVMRRGVTIGADSKKGFRGGICKGDRSVIEQLAAKPGEIVVFVKKLSIWEKMQK